ncbi:MAG: AAA family ATPase, partial [Clostridia bacterium]|nr:AAA family ATPase [Clostridia bacterium]
YYESENFIIRKLSLLNKVFPQDNYLEVNNVISQIQFEEGIEYAEMHKKAIHTAVDNGVMILTGGPGTGKTTIIRAIIRLAERMGYSVALAAPTGRAAKRMSEATGNQAKTIHRMLEMKYIDDEQVFSRDENNLLDEDFFIIDETSMVDTILMSSLLKAVKPGARIILIGDVDQLPSVGAGNVFADLISSDFFAVVRLTEIFRQASESRIVTNAHAINNGELPVLDDKNSDFFFISRDESDIGITIADLCKKRLPKKFGDSVIEDIQIITPSHRGAAGTDILNPLLQNIMNPPSNDKKERKFRDVVFREGDKVMQCRNNYDIEWDRSYERGAGIFNGDIGIVKEIDLRGECMIIDFDGRITSYGFDLLEDLEHAYAVTIHKSQGSEYPIVIIPMYNYGSKLLTRNLLYTAVTRAQRMVIMVGRRDVVQGMVENYRAVSRYTGLKAFIKQYENI